MGRFLWIVGVAVLWPSTAAGGACSEFTWHHPQEMVMPHLIHEGQKAMETNALVEAREMFATYLLANDKGVFADGAEWAVASLPDVTEEPGKDFLTQIERLQAMKVAHPDSAYAPWALCMMGQFYWDAGWHSEANALFEEFLSVYPEHPLAGGIMVEAGLGYLKKQQFLEAALILRRVVEEPKWEAHRASGALGLADATAMSKVWGQAYYWYRVVEAESPDLIRESEQSSYYYGLTEVEVGDSQKAIPRFLTTVNLHPQKKIAGQALNRISEKLQQDGHEFLSLWFAEQATQRFGGQEAGRRGQAAQIRWVVEFLSRDHSKEEWAHVYQRLNDLDLYISVSWDNVVETARILSHAPEPDIVEESLLWMGRGNVILEDISAAIESLRSVAIVATSERGRQEAQQRLSVVLNQEIHMFYDQQAWVSLLKFHEDQREAFHVIPLTREHVRRVAQAYQHINLPGKAMQWYDQLLQDHPKSPLREEIFAQKVFLAEGQGKSQLVREAGEIYVHEYPQGQWRAEVSTALGMESVGRQDYGQAIQHLSDVLTQTHDAALQRYVLRHRALAYQKEWKPELALLDLQQVVALDPLDMVNVVRLGDFQFDQGDFADAESQYEHVLSSKASEALKVWAKYRSGLSLDYQGSATKARSLLAEVRQLHTRAPEFENTIRTAAVAVLEEFSLQEALLVGRVHEGS